MVTRRQFNQGLVALTLGGLSAHLRGTELASQLSDFNSQSLPIRLLPDPNEIIDLPDGFSYQVISKLGESMDNGYTVPDRADGMGCFAVDNERVVLVRNHELAPLKQPKALTHNIQAQPAKAYDTYSSGTPLPGGTSNIVYNLKTKQVEYQCMSLLGTIRNCSGGITPWGSWLSCEESVVTASDKIHKNHGYVFEVPSTARDLVDALPIKAMGRFNHEAACVDPETGIVYLTEDRQDSLFYRFIPNVQGNLHAGGKLQALMVSEQPKFDTRNTDKANMLENQEYACHWLDLEDVDSPKDDLRHRGFTLGAAIFARGEGIHFGIKDMYFCCTSGGRKQLGQIMRYTPHPLENGQTSIDQTGTLNLFVESTNKTTFNYGDNITFSPNGHLIVCEDQYTDVVNNHLKGVTPQGNVYDFARIHWQTEPAGACFSPDGSVMFVNLYSPTTTLAITGPWESLNAKN
jgi:secreted PhoX family phosphatase